MKIEVMRRWFSNRYFNGLHLIRDKKVFFTQSGRCWRLMRNETFLGLLWEDEIIKPKKG